MPHGVQVDGQYLFFAQKNLLGGPAPVRRYLPYLMELVLNREINPGKVFDLEVLLTDVAEGYRAMDEAGQSRRCFGFDTEGAPCSA